ncbi:hypothetical protein L226DRAFT_576951 [Lentinus tigrinus ALCF2SS1-7]|uniref:Uncharacterized protein n=1 Tax=Lentinus tigrinus ALCF2SS1-6 TaxID=1328759 RepID=A0A5C2RKX6_9APHY|nr:hypothetical protein L227DRAFT_617928 [Lentinus tigrinus ALCF2SS1-6]RPD67786.1 hypothetical protein L226DRAFT_576951 [Lentinus tigrinus ALCF2SS1-7]
MSANASSKTRFRNRQNPSCWPVSLSCFEELLESMDPFYDIQRFLQENLTAFSFEDAPDYS